MPDLYFSSLKAAATLRCRFDSRLLAGKFNTRDTSPISLVTADLGVGEHENELNAHIEKFVLNKRQFRHTPTSVQGVDGGAISPRMLGDLGLALHSGKTRVVDLREGKGGVKRLLIKKRGRNLRARQAQ